MRVMALLIENSGLIGVKGANCWWDPARMVVVARVMWGMQMRRCVIAYCEAEKKETQQHLKNITINSFTDVECWGSCIGAIDEQKEEEKGANIIMFKWN